MRQEDSAISDITSITESSPHLHHKHKPSLIVVQWRPARGTCNRLLATPVREGKRFARSSYVPPALTIAARWGQFHLFSFAWLGVLGYMGFGSNGFGGGGVVSVLVQCLFALPGIWMQLSGWFEKVRLGPEGIEYIDFLGRSRVRASLEEIVSAELVKSSESSRVQIHTLRGTITIGNHFWLKGKVLAEVERLVAGRGA